MLNMPMASALGLLSLPEEISNALLRREGFLGDLLTLAEACESSDDSVFDRKAGVLHLSSQQINLAHAPCRPWPGRTTCRTELLESGAGLECAEAFSVTPSYKRPMSDH